MRTIRNSWLAAAVGIGLLLASPVAPLGASMDGEPEEPSESGVSPLAEPEALHYTWYLQGITGIVARLFVPGRGEGVLETRVEGDFLRSELRLTARGSNAGEFWSYQATIDPATGLPTAASTEYRFRKREKLRDAEFEPDSTVVDIPSGIRLLRTRPPEKPTRMRIWSDGKVYPVLFLAGELELRKIDGASVPLTRYEVRGLDVPGERRWKGRLEVWLTRDAGAIPVEIRFSRLRARVHLELSTPLPASASAS